MSIKNIIPISVSYRVNEGERAIIIAQLIEYQRAEMGVFSQSYLVFVLASRHQHSDQFQKQVMWRYSSQLFTFLLNTLGRKLMKFCSGKTWNWENAVHTLLPVMYKTKLPPPGKGAKKGHWVPTIPLNSASSPLLFSLWKSWISLFFKHVLLKILLLAH